MKNKRLFENIASRVQDYQSPIQLDEEWQALQDHRKRTKNQLLHRYLLLLLLVLIGSCSLGKLLFKHKDQIASQQEEPTLSRQKQSAPSPVSSLEKSKASQQGPLSSTATNSKQSTISRPYFSSNQRQQTASIKAASSKQQIITKQILPPKSSEQAALLMESVAEKNTQIQRTDNQSQQYFSSPLSIDGFDQINSRPLNAHPASDLGDRFLWQPASSTSSESHKWSLCLGGGLLSSPQTLKARTAAAEAHLADRQAQESTLETYHFEVGLRYALSQRSYLNIGLGYDQSFERLRFNYERNQNYLLEDVVVKIIQYNNGDPDLEIIGDTLVEGKQLVSGVAHSEYNAYHLSFMAGHQIWRGRKFSLAVAAGVNWNFKTRVKGKIPALDGRGMPQDLEQNEVYKNAFGLGLMANVEVNYQLNKNWSIFAQPQLSRYLSSITNEDYQLKSTLSRYGGMIGLQYRW